MVLWLCCIFQRQQHQYQHCITLIRYSLTHKQASTSQQQCSCWTEQLSKLLYAITSNTAAAMLQPAPHHHGGTKAHSPHGHKSSILPRHSPAARLHYAPSLIHTVVPLIRSPSLDISSKLLFTINFYFKA